MQREQLQAILEGHKQWLNDNSTGQRANLQGADLQGAYLQKADLRGANLWGADLRGVDLQGSDLQETNLRGTYLQRANLQGADLRGADLRGGNLQGVNLQGANLQGANLQGAYLREANLQEARIDTGELWEDYLANIVPSLLTAGGKTVREIIDSGAWQCHEWANCPMHIAFGISSAEEGPALLIPRIRQFVQFFDAGLIPEPKA